MPPSIRSDIAIIGAGPAGATAAIALARKGIPALLIDKYEFPRRKICGDGLSGKVVSNLNRLDPSFVSELSVSGFATKSHAVRFYSPNLKMMELSFQPDQPSYPPGFISKRTDFDHFLLGKALTFTETVNEAAAKYDYPLRDIGFYVQPVVYGGACHFECDFYYNPANPAEVSQIKNLCAEAAEAALNRGGFFSRPYGAVADMVYDRSASYTAELKKVKKVMDPNNIMSPGRLGL